MKNIFITLVFLFTAIVTSSSSDWTFEINPKNIKMFSADKLQRPKWYLDSFKVKNMVNLSFFNSKTYIGPYKDDRVVSFNFKRRWSFFTIENGEAFIYDGKSWGQSVNPTFTNGLEPNYVVSGYPVLVRDGQRTKITKSFFSRRRCPRTAIGIHPNGSLILYVTSSATLKELQSYFLSMGCTDAINFDGGSSTFLYLDGKKVYSSNQGRSYPNVLSWE